MRRQYTYDDFSYMIGRWNCPATIVIILINVVTLVLNLLANWLPFPSPTQLLAFTSVDWMARPWSIVTYPLVGDPFNLIGMLFACYWLWWVGGSLERAWSTRVFAWFFFIISAITAFSLAFGAGMFAFPVGLMGLWMPIAALTVAWATLDPEQQILLYMIIPLKAKYLAYLDVAIVFISYGAKNPLIGLFALGGCLAAWRYVHFRRSSPGRSQTPVIRLHRRRSRLNPFDWLRDRQEQKRLRKLLGEDRRGPDDREGWR